MFGPVKPRPNSTRWEAKDTGSVFGCRLPRSSILFAAMAKHVIFLGAGASASSGYPCAGELKRRLASCDEFIAPLEKHPRAKLVERDPVRFRNYFERHQESIDLFRKGGFGTVDEFCKLASGSGYAQHVDVMRRMLRLVLALHNPEEEFQKSEYYGFVQQLFSQENLAELRQDVSILSYNYDPYLEYLLCRALETRKRMLKEPTKPTTDELNAVTGGFHDPTNLNWIEQGEPNGPAFCLIKLHGSICGVNDSSLIGHKDVFETEWPRWVDRLLPQPPNDAEAPPPPVLFPWETGKASEPSETSPEMRLIAKSWDRARREMARADKISFVGLSMHAFLEDGLDHLFSLRQKNATFEVLSVSLDNVTQRAVQAPFWANNRTTPAGRLGRFLGKRRIEFQGEDYRGIGDLNNVTVRTKFSDFIQKDLG